MKKKARLISLLLVFAMVAATVPAFAYTKGSLLPQVKTYKTAFTDTKGTWCDQNVQTVYEVGLMNGKSAAKFDPKGNLTCAQIIVITARLHELLNGGDGKFDAPGKNEEWYQPYLDYLEKLGASNDALQEALYWVEDEPYTACDRYDFVWLLSAVLPDSALTAINSITALPDVYGDTDVLRFYNAGILTGINGYGVFSGTSTLNRGQAAAMLGRIVDPSQRIKFTPKAFSYAKELLGVDANTTVLTIDGWDVSAELYAYMLSTEISSFEISAQYDYYDTYAQYLDAYYDDANFYNYDTFADYLLAVHGIDVSTECAVKWNVPDKAGLTPAEKVQSNTLDTLKQIAELFVHQSDYPLTTAQKSEIAAQTADSRELFYGFSDELITLAAETYSLGDNMTKKYTPSKSEMNSYLAQYGYFYGQYIVIAYDTGSEKYYGLTKAEALQQMNTIRASASGHTDDSDYFDYLAWKYSADSSYGPTLSSIEWMSGTNQTALKNLSVGALSGVLCEEDPSSGAGEYLLFLKGDPSTDEDTMYTIGSIPAIVKLDSWAENAKIVTTSVYNGFSIAALAAKYDALDAAGLTGGI